MAAWGVLAVCGIGGGVAGPLLDTLARRVRRPGSAEAPGDPPSPVGVGPDLADVAGLADVADVVDVFDVFDVADLAGGSTSTASTPPPQLVGVPSPGPVQPRFPPPGQRPPRASRTAVLAEGAAAAIVLAAACVLAALRLGSTPQLPAYCVLAGALLVVSVTDLRTGLVPRRIVYAAAAAVGVGLLCASAADDSWRPMLDAVIGAVVAFGVFAAVWWVAPRAMGFGDVRLAGLCGGALGWLGFAPLYFGFLAGFVAGAVMGLAVLAARGRHRFPFAPALAVGTMLGVLWGTWLGNLWLHGG